MQAPEGLFLPKISPDVSIQDLGGRDPPNFPKRGAGMQEDPLLSQRLKLTIITCCFEMQVLENRGNTEKGEERRNCSIYPNFQQVACRDIPNITNGSNAAAVVRHLRMRLIRETAPLKSSPQRVWDNPQRSGCVKTQLKNCRSFS